MVKINYKCYWLPHISEEVWSGSNDKRYFDTYLIALEAWRRGLKINYYAKHANHFTNVSPDSNILTGRLISISSFKRTHYFFRSRLGTTSNSAIDLARNKKHTKALLDKSGIMVPKGFIFNSDESDIIIRNYVNKIGFPIVVKPSNLGLGIGVTANINDRTDLEEALRKVRKVLRKRDEEKEIIIEEHILGEEYRAFVVGDKVISVLKRLTANIIGNGKKSIYELIANKNNLRKLNPHLSSRLINIDDTLIYIINSAGYSLNSILEKGKMIFLKNVGNFAMGGDPLDVTDDLTDEVKITIIKALKAIPGLEHGGIDFIINEEDDKNAYVLEINGTPTVATHLFPIEGQGRDVPAALIDYYFPETKGNYISDRMQYFDLNNVLKPLINKVAFKVELMPPVYGNIYAMKYSITGNELGIGYLDWFKYIANKLSLYGYVKCLSAGTVELVISSNEKIIIEHFLDYCRSSLNMLRPDDWVAEEYLGPIKIGFFIEVDEANNSDLMLKFEQNKIEIGNMKIKLSEAISKLKSVKKKYKTMRNTRVWRYFEFIQEVIFVLKKPFFRYRK